jgi:hypothetical protein
VTYYGDDYPFLYALYIAPTGAVLNRMSVRKHWPTDIVVGAAIGVGIGRFLAKRHMAYQRGETAGSGGAVDVQMGLNSARLTYTF